MPLPILDSSDFSATQSMMSEWARANFMIKHIKGNYIFHAKINIF